MPSDSNRHKLKNKTSIQGDFSSIERVGGGKFGIIPEGWKMISFGEIGTVLGGGTPHTKNINYWNGNIPWISSSDLFEEKIYKINTDRFITSSAVENSSTKIIPKNSILVVSRVGVGKVAINTTELCTSQDFLNIIPNADINNIFVAYLIKAEVPKLLKFNQGTTIKGFTYNDFKSIRVTLPGIKEQQKIAEILGKIDKAIENSEKMMMKQERIKTGLMQDLLIRGIDKNGNIRDESTHKFKDSELGRIPEEWIWVSVGDYIQIQTGKKNTQDKENGGLYDFYVRSQEIEKINSYSFEGEGVLTAGDGVGVGKIYHYANGKFDYHQRVYLMHEFGEIFDGKFFYYFFKENFKKRIDNFSAKTTVDSVRYDMIAKMLIPKFDIKEQKKIANILSLQDNLIIKELVNLCKLKRIKTGLMQDLLTGKVRVDSLLLQ